VEILIDLFEAGELLDHLVAGGPLLLLLHVQGVQLIRLLQDRVYPDLLLKVGDQERNKGGSGRWQMIGTGLRPRGDR
jgi:hypothetical protein